MHGGPFWNQFPGCKSSPKKKRITKRSPTKRPAARTGDRLYLTRKLMLGRPAFRLERKSAIQSVTHTKTVTQKCLASESKTAGRLEIFWNYHNLVRKRLKCFWPGKNRMQSNRSGLTPCLFGQSATVCRWRPRTGVFTDKFAFRRVRRWWRWPPTGTKCASGREPSNAIAQSLRRCCQRKSCER